MGMIEQNKNWETHWKWFSLNLTRGCFRWPLSSWRWKKKKRKRKWRLPFFSFCGSPNSAHTHAHCSDWCDLNVLRKCWFIYKESYAIPDKKPLSVFIFGCFLAGFFPDLSDESRIGIKPKITELPARNDRTNHGLQKQQFNHLLSAEICSISFFKVNVVIIKFLRLGISSYNLLSFVRGRFYILQP